MEAVFACERRPGSYQPFERLSFLNGVLWLDYKKAPDGYHRLLPLERGISLGFAGRLVAIWRAYYISLSGSRSQIVQTLHPEQRTGDHLTERLLQTAVNRTIQSATANENRGSILRLTRDPIDRRHSCLM